MYLTTTAVPLTQTISMLLPEPKRLVIEINADDRVRAHGRSVHFISRNAVSLARINSCSYAPERPPTMSRTLAKRSFIRFAPRIASPETIPR